MTLRRKWLHVGALLASAALIASCSGMSNSVDRAALTNVLKGGFEADVQLDQLTSRLTRKCMEKLGYRVHPVVGGSASTSTPASSSNVEISMGARLIFREDRVREIGYGRSPIEMHQGPASTAEEEEFEQLSRDEQNRYWKDYQGYSPDEIDQGRKLSNDQVELPNQHRFTMPDGTVITYPREGCLAEMQAELFGGKVRQYHELSYYAHEGIGKAAIGSVETDSKVRDGNKKWSACMTAKGFPGLKAPIDALNKASSSYGAYVYGPDSPGYADVKKQEVELASADYACNREVGLDDIRVSVFWRNTANYYSDRETELQAWRETVSAALSRGQQLLSA
jgi:hypothetical protein